jgi:hypothetical protein
MARSFCVPGILFLTAAFVLSLLVSISLPLIKPMDIVRVHGGSELRLGIWAWCSQAPNAGWACGKTGYGYSVNLSTAGQSGSQDIGASWTRGLILHPIATAIIFVAWLLGFSEHVTVSLIASLVSFLGALFTLIAFAIDIALYVHVRKQVNDLHTINSNTDAGPGFWMTLATFVLLLLAGCTVCFGRRRERTARGTTSNSYNYAKRPWYRRFGRRY